MLKRIFLNPVSLLLIIIFISTFLFVERGVVDPMTIPLIDNQGHTTTLAKYKKSHQVTILFFWASWSKHSKSQANTLNQLIAEKPGLNVIGIQIDDSDSNDPSFANYKNLKALNKSELIMTQFGDHTDRIPLVVVMDHTDKIMGSFAGETNLTQLKNIIEK